MTLANDRAKALQRLSVSRETERLLDRYVTSIVAWQRVRNLVARSTLESIWTRHVLDCAQLAPLVPSHATRLVDLGSGAGLPGLVLAILLKTRPGLVVHLVESDQRKASFLRTVARELDLPVDVHAKRIEEVTASLPPCDVVTARALADLPHLLAYADPLLKTGAIGLFMKGERVADELTDSGLADRFTIEFAPSQTQDGAVIVMVRTRAA